MTDIRNAEGELFALDQWWVQELESIGTDAPCTADQYRAVRISLQCIRIALTDQPVSEDQP